MDNLDELERQRTANRERQRRRREEISQEERDIQNERRRLNYQQSDSKRDTHRERSRLSQERRREEMSDTQIIIIRYSQFFNIYYIAACVSTGRSTGFS
jgi:hydroxyacyl-ACP dehydratase HTD2-like protein with hotdog domain